jgi:hypothetical protein
MKSGGLTHGLVVLPIVFRSFFGVVGGSGFLEERVPISDVVPVLPGSPTAFGFQGIGWHPFYRHLTKKLYDLYIRCLHRILPFSISRIV